MQALMRAGAGAALLPAGHEAAQRPRMTRQQFAAWTRTASPGEQVTYHRGYLAIDRLPAESTLPEPGRRELVAVADLARALAEQGRLHLLQRRHGEGDYSYLAVARHRRRT